MGILGIGIELEGNFEAREILPSSLIQDGSLSGLATRGLKTGESRSPVLPNIAAARNWIYSNHPTEVNETCGLHVHVSVQDAAEYDRLAAREFYDSFIVAAAEFVQERIRPRSVGAAEWCERRLAGDNRYCCRNWVPCKHHKEASPSGRRHRQAPHLDRTDLRPNCQHNCMDTIDDCYRDGNCSHDCYDYCIDECDHDCSSDRECYETCDHDCFYVRCHQSCDHECNNECWDNGGRNSCEHVNNCNIADGCKCGCLDWDVRSTIKQLQIFSKAKWPLYLGNIGRDLDGHISNGEHDNACFDDCAHEHDRGDCYECPHECEIDYCFTCSHEHERDRCIECQHEHYEGSCYSCDHGCYGDAQENDEWYCLDWRCDHECTEDECGTELEALAPKEEESKPIDYGMHIPLKQRCLKSKGEPRYAHVNYCQGLHGTIEFRLFAGMPYPDLTAAAVEFIYRFVNKFLGESTEEASVDLPCQALAIVSVYEI